MTKILHIIRFACSHLCVEVGAVIGESSRGLNACLHRSLLFVRAACPFLGFRAKGQHLIVIGRSAVDVAEGVRQHSMGCAEGREEGVSAHGTAEGSGIEDVLVREGCGGCVSVCETTYVLVEPEYPPNVRGDLSYHVRRMRKDNIRDSACRAEPQRVPVPFRVKSTRDRHVPVRGNLPARSEQGGKDPRSMV